VISEWLSRAIMCNSGYMEGLSVGPRARDGNCQIFPLEISTAGIPLVRRNSNTDVLAYRKISVEQIISCFI
jgi:hypothetical protein